MQCYNASASTLHVLPAYHLILKRISRCDVSGLLRVSVTTGPLPNE
jgi:hypothetical protein